MRGVSGGFRNHQRSPHHSLASAASDVTRRRTAATFCSSRTTAPGIISPLKHNHTNHQPQRRSMQANSSRPASARPASGRKQMQEQQQRSAAPTMAPAVGAEPQPGALLAGGSSQAGGQQQPQPPPAGRSLEARLPEDIHMDQIIDKLQLLNYEREFCQRKKPRRKGLTPCYFVSAQPGLTGNEQFFYFCSLAVWLLRLCGVTLPTPKEFDDPNATLQGILQGLRALGFAPPSFPPTKLSAGCGREVCGLLDSLLDAALEARGCAKLPKTLFASASGDEGDAALVEEVGDEDDAADITSQAAAALLLEAEDSSSSSDAVLSGLLRTSTVGLAPGQPGAAAAVDAAATVVLVSTVDPVAWKLEVERVGPKLRASLPADMRDWRAHLDAAHTHLASLTAAWPDVRSHLESLSSEVCASLDKVDGREQQLNGQLEGLLGSYREARLQLNDMQEELSRRSELISERNNELHRVTAALDDVKQQLECRGSNLSDASPLVRLKAALSSLREELKGMELRIGVVAHNLVSLSLQGKQAALNDAAARGARDVPHKAGGLLGAAGGGGK